MSDQEKRIQKANRELAKTDSEGLPNSVAYRLEYCLPLASRLIVEAEDTMDGGEYRIPIELESTNIVTVILIPEPGKGTMTLRVLTSTSTTPNY